jgi:hypothetical protein
MAERQGLRAGDERFRLLATRWRYKGVLQERDPSDPWRKEFEADLAKFEKREEAVSVTSGDLPPDLPF